VLRAGRDIRKALVQVGSNQGDIVAGAHSG
jgi:hypothetical protein